MEFLLLCLVFLLIFLSIIEDIIFKHNCKKSNYDCFNCKNYDCYVFYCDKKRGELNE